ncbi:MAG: Bacillolysin [Anaerolineales bacterium]|nr:Bacillolysin [Anaerolineales bacterium]
MNYGLFLKRLLFIIVVIPLLLPRTTAAVGSSNPTPDLTSLRDASIQPVTVTWDPHTRGPAFVTGQFPSGTRASELAVEPLSAAQRFLTRHAAAFGMRDPAREFTLIDAEVDQLGMTHLRLQQAYQGVPVMGADLRVHFDSTGQWVTAINGDYLAGIELPTAKPSIRAKSAVRTARASLPKGRVGQPAQLVVVDGRLTPAVTGAHLAWRIELYDHRVPARNIYLIDAHTGLILDSYNGLTTGRDRQTYTANHERVLPGTLWLTEAGPVEGESPDADGLNAHEFAGNTYDYYWDTHRRDSYDDGGATLIATVHYGESYPNAFWNGSQMVYGDGYASANDVVAHELTHAVTEYTANLTYQYQSGALNESFSDIFGAMVDRGDWLMGEDLPIGAIRSLADPPAYQQPGHLDDYNTTCSDNGGVHINSGIPNKVAYLMSEALGRSTAEQIFYRTLTYYLTSSSEFNDARASAIQSAEDLFGTDSAEAVTTAFAAVGLDGVRVPPEHSCDCAASLTLNDRSLFSDMKFAIRATTTLYRARDELLSATPAGQRYIDLYYAHTGQISRLLAKDPRLRAEAARTLRAIVPGLAALLDGNGDKVIVTPEMIQQLQALLDRLAAADPAGALAKTIAGERSRIELESLAGLTFEEAWRAISDSRT